MDVTFELDACDVGSSTILLRLYGPGADALVKQGATHSENAGRFAAKLKSTVPVAIRCGLGQLDAFRLQCRRRRLRMSTIDPLRTSPSGGFAASEPRSLEVRLGLGANVIVKRENIRLMQTNRAFQLQPQCLQASSRARLRGGTTARLLRAAISRQAGKLRYDAGQQYSR